MDTAIQRFLESGDQIKDKHILYVAFIFHRQRCNRNRHQQRNLAQVGIALRLSDAGSASDGRRVYPAEQVAQLTEVKRLIDGGMRPSQVIHARPNPADSQTQNRAGSNQSSPSSVVIQSIEALRNHQLIEFRSLLERDLTSRGLRVFIEETATQLNWAVGKAWANGGLRVFEEHLYSATLHDLLTQRTHCLSLPAGIRASC